MRRMRKLVPLLLAAALGLAVSACGGDDDAARTAKDVPADAIALVGDTPVPRAEFDALMERAEASYKAQKKDFPKVGTPEYQDLKTRAVAFLVERYTFQAEATELGIEVPDADVDKELQKIVETNFDGDEAKLASALEREGLTEEQARADLRERLLRERVFEDVTKDVEVTDEEIRKHYDKNKAQFTQPASRTVRHIVVKSRERANELHEQLEAGADFAALAREHSTDSSTARVGGRLPVTRGSTLPAFDKVAFELDQGEFSQPVKTSFGWHIVLAVSRVKPEKTTPLEQVEDSLRDQLKSEEQNAALREWLDAVKEKYEARTVYAPGFAPPKTDTGTETTGVTTTTSG